MSTLRAPRRLRQPPRPRAAQQGAVAIMVGLSLVVLIGAAGLSIDAGRLYVAKSELQSAVDACALAAARELVCTGTDTSCLANAEAAGQTVAARHKADLQAAAVSASVTFASTLSGSYAARTAGAAATARHVRCTAQVGGIQPWLMGVLGASNSTVAASAVATTAPAQDFCLSTPMALCSSGAGSNFGYTVNQWITVTSTASGQDASLGGSLRWASITGNTSTNAIRDQLEGSTPACGKAQGSTVTLSNGTQQGTKSAYNTRFGLYPNGAGAATPSTVPPDRTGYAYPSKTLGIGTDVYGDYLSRRASFTPFTPNDYKGNPPGNGKGNGNGNGNGNAGGSYSGNPITQAAHQQYGTDRRLISVAVTDCTAGTPRISGVACLLMLNPMGDGATSDLHFQYLGNASSGTTPCGSTGTPGGSTSSGPRVPMLEQ